MNLIKFAKGLLCQNGLFVITKKLQFELDCINNGKGKISRAIIAKEIRRFSDTGQGQDRRPGASLQEI